MRLTKRLMSAGVLIFLLGGCQSSKIRETGQNQPLSLSPDISPQTITLFAQPNIQKITLPAGLVAHSSTVPPDLSPISFVYGKTFKSNTKGTLVVWFVPGKGLIRWRESDASIRQFYQPTEWFYENPYFEFYGDSNRLILIDKKGSEVVWIDMETESATSKQVPYPFGTVFFVSPDLGKILYVEGYRQTVGTPSYLVTNVDGISIGQFKSKAEISDRSFVAWMPDSQKVVVLEDKNNLVSYAVDGSQEPELVGKLTDEDEVISFQEYKSWLYITTKKSWIAYDLNERKIVKRLPVEALAALNRPRLIPFTSDSILIEEDVIDFDQAYKRLWMSDWLGKKNIVVPEYGKRVSSASPI